MAYLILLLIVLNLVAGGSSITGKNLRLGNHPALLRLRWFGFGGVLCLLVSGHGFTNNDWTTWIPVISLALGVARMPDPNSSSSKTRQQNTAPNPSGPVR